MKTGGLFWFAAIVAFIGWVMLATQPNERFVRACTPVQWIGNVTLSVTAFVDPSGEAATKHFFTNTGYACRYMLWRLFYGQAWEREQKRLRDQGLPAGVPGQQSSTTEVPK